MTVTVIVIVIVTVTATAIVTETATVTASFRTSIANPATGSAIIAPKARAEKFA